MKLENTTSMKEVDILEFGIFHWVSTNKTSLPGLTQDGHPSKEFFGFINEGQSRDLNDITWWIETHLSKWSTKLHFQPLILCSGGVDSSTLVATASASSSPYELLHTAYINHNNNDLSKLSTLLEHFPSIAHIASIDSHKYREGLELLWKNKILQNTYAPTICYALNAINHGKSRLLVTGSGPDEMFYGMEKYTFDYFKSREHLPIPEALEQIDTAYNLNAYLQILNKNGMEIMEQVMNRRRELYSAISNICPSIYNAQRMLAYCTVTSQHVSLFDGLAKINDMTHIAPFLDEDFIKLVFSIPVQNLIDPGRKDSKVEIGKYHLKKFLEKFMPEIHVWSKKIGFHAPTTSYMYSTCFQSYFEKMDYDILPKFIDKDKAKKLLLDRLTNHGNKSPTDYFLYSILNISELFKRKGN